MDSRARRIRDACLGAIAGLLVSFVHVSMVRGEDSGPQARGAVENEGDRLFEVGVRLGAGFVSVVPKEELPPVGAIPAFDARVHLARWMSVGVQAQWGRAPADEHDAYSVDGHLWLLIPWRVARPWLGLGGGILGSSVKTKPAVVFDAGVDFCLLGYEDADGTCGVVLGPELGTAALAVGDSSLALVRLLGVRGALSF